jgi:hypothetical protein
VPSKGWWHTIMTQIVTHNCGRKTAIVKAVKLYIKCLEKLDIIGGREGCTQGLPFDGDSEFLQMLLRLFPPEKVTS